MSDFANEEDGIVLVITALMIVSLFASVALTVDIGQIYLTRSRLQAAADSAALAGARKLIESGDLGQVDSTVNNYITKNFGQSLPAAIEIIENTRTVSVKLGRNVKFFFAPVIGLTETHIDVKAMATAQIVSKANHVVPFGVVKQNFQYGELYVLKYGSGDLEGAPYFGNFGALALGGTGAKIYENNIKYGYSGEITTGQNMEIETEPGNMSGPTADGVDYRKSLCTHSCSFETRIEPNCPRVVITPVIDSLAVEGRSEITVLGFAAFFLEDTINGPKGQQYVTGRFIKWSVTGEGGNGENYGVFTVGLVE